VGVGALLRVSRIVSLAAHPSLAPSRGQRRSALVTMGQPTTHRWSCTPRYAAIPRDGCAWRLSPWILRFFVNRTCSGADRSIRGVFSGISGRAVVKATGQAVRRAARRRTLMGRPGCLTNEVERMCGSHRCLGHLIWDKLLITMGNDPRQPERYAG
jgi:hypothetical protein